MRFAVLYLQFTDALIALLYLHCIFIKLLNLVPQAVILHQTTGKTQCSVL